jgi:hypothetical protein
MPPERPGRENTEEIGVECQLQAFPTRIESGAPSREEPWSWFLGRKLRQFRAEVAVRTGLAALVKRMRRGPGPPSRLDTVVPVAQTVPHLKVGDLVRVRAADEVRSMLDDNGSLKGCAFGLGMYRYCGKEFRVVKIVERFFDEGRWRMLKARNMVLLEGVYCDGQDISPTKGCDRMCFFFWRTEWLEKVEGSAARENS